MLSLLAVENHPATRDYLAEVLRSAGYEVRTAGDVAQAWELFVTRKPDALLVDLALVDAASLLEQVRSATAAVPILVFDQAHLGQAHGLTAAMRLKPDAYVPDISQRTLHERLEQLLARSADGAPSGVLTVLGRPAALHGQLRVGTLPATLLTLLRTFRDGILVLQQGAVERRIYLRGGAPIAVDSTEREEALDRWLVHAGRLTEAQYGEALRERAGASLSTAASLVAVGAVEPGQPLLNLLREHLHGMLAKWIGLKQGVFRFHPGSEFFGEVQALDIAPLAPILAGARAGFPLRTFVAAIQPDRARYPRRAAGFSEILPQLGLVPRDLKMALELNGELSTAEVIASRRHQLREAASLLWFLKLVDAVTFEAVPAPPVPGAARPVIPAERLKPLPAEELTQIRESALAVLPGTYFHALGVDIACTPDEVERAYHQATERLHPDRFAGYDVGEVEDLLNQVQDKLSAAYRILSHPEKRVGYLESLLQRADGLRQGRPLLAAAEIALKQAERAVGERGVREAVELCQQACELSPREPDFQAALALLHYCDRSVASDLRLSNTRKAARKALQLDAENVRAQIALAMVERDLGNVAEARRQVLAVLRTRPKMALARWLLGELNRVP